MTIAEETRPRRTSLAELPLLAGEPLGYSRWHTVGQDRIDAFAETTEDRQWIHVDPQRAAQGQYGGTIAHGFLTLSMITVLSQEILVIEDVATMINYGLDRVRFAVPVPAGSAIRARGQILSTRSRPRGLVEMVLRLWVEVALPDGIERACTADWVTLLQAQTA
jgi:acyl dehydratase